MVMIGVEDRLGSERHGDLQRIRGTGLSGPDGPPNRQGAPGRRCKTCGLPLSVYNRTDRCWSHGPDPDAPLPKLDHDWGQPERMNHATQAMFKHGCQCIPCQEANDAS